MRVKNPPHDRKAAIATKATRPRVYATSFGGSPDGVVPYVNLRFLPCWGTTDFAQIGNEIRRTLALGVAEVALYVDWLMWNNDGGTYRYSHAGASNLASLCHFLQGQGLLRFVKFWWLPDEPCRDKKISDADFRQCALDMRSVSAGYPELSDVGYVVIWGDEHDRRPAKELMTGQGLDDYGLGAGILDAYPDLERDMGPEQFSVLVPGMYTLEHKPMVIEQFLPYLQTHPKCRMMCPFLYDALQGGYSVNGSASRVMAVADAVKAMNDPAYVHQEPTPALTEWPEGIAPPQAYVDPPRDGGQNG